MSTRDRGTTDAFVMDTLRRHGARVSQLKKNTVRAVFEKTPPFAEKPEITVAFERKSIDMYPDAILAKAGSPFYLKLLDSARSGGAVTHVYTPVVEPLSDAPPSRMIDGPGVTWTAGKRALHPHVVFNFAISYQSVVTSDDLLSIGYDVVRDAFREPEVIDALHSVWSETLPSSPERWGQIDAPEPGSLLPRVLDVLDSRIHRKAARAKRNTQRYLDREIQSVEDYYRQLIAEEKEVMNRLSRTSPKEAAEREKRIRRYQLDWKRRIAEEQRHHQCRVHIRLVNVAVAYMPRTALTIACDRWTSPTECYFNHFLGTLDGVVCAASGHELGPWEIASDGRWLSRSRDGMAPRDEPTDDDPATDIDDETEEVQR